MGARLGLCRYLHPLSAWVSTISLWIRRLPSILYAATTNGFYKSTNRGRTWSLKRVGRCWDISVHPGGGKVELLATFQDGLFASTNGGNTFAAVSLPLAPSAAWTRLAVDRVTAAPDVAYAFGAAGTAAHLWRRSGTAWTKITSVPSTLSVNQAWYDWYVTATPDKKDQVYIGAIDALRGDLAGSTWSWTNITTHGANSIHPDQHCLTFAPGNSKVIYAGNDGGIYRSTNSGSTWIALNKGLAITEIEYMASDPNTWKWLMAGTQDNGTIRFTGASKWDHIADGDGGDCGVNQQNPNTVLSFILQRHARTLEQQGQHLDMARTAERRVSILSTGRGGRPDSRDRRGLAGGHTQRRPAVGDRLTRSLLWRGVDCDARDRCQHPPDRHQYRPHVENDLDGRSLEQDRTHIASCKIHQLHCNRSIQPAAVLGNKFPGDRGWRAGLSFGQWR